ncbi:hypothetical protein [Corynebacterium sp. J010B-136]|uniref:hypothetical protein n=1 Tax=Corynebacterium sp. J010B-136 TaxID=2099401 RepID=UPI000CF91E89|nr:hypothetical protein [Corynebacterium sp. J010B-136]PQM73964.1 hypothetical protein C5Y44_08940 [Corynebacterium sp. J010B-136]
MITIKPERLGSLVPRMLELTSRTTPWHRLDWRAGTLELVEETLNEVMIPGTRTQALEQLREYMKIALRDDDGVTGTQKKLNDCVKHIDPSSAHNSHNVELAQYHVKDLKKTYLQNWADLLEEPDRAGQVDVEGTAKRIISHLIYCGVPPASVYQVIHDQQQSSVEVTLSDVLRELDEKSKSRPRDFSFAIPVDRTPKFLHSSPAPRGWLTPKQLKQWKHQNAPRADVVRHYGGFVLTVQARDVNEAAAEIQRLLPQLSFKFQAGSENGFSILPVMWSKERGTEFPTKRTSHPLKIKAFQRADTLDDLHINYRTRNILALIEPLKTNDSHVAVVNGWVALESLLVDSVENDRLAAERMARVVAASYFRTEMTWLARNYVDAYKGKSFRADEIGKADTSAERAKMMANLIKDEENFELLAEVDRLAIRKMHVALTKPGEVFDRTQKILAREFQRLYRKRNLFVHGGRAVEHGIDSIDEKVVPLLVNGIDQLLIANIQYGLDPQAFAASIAFKASHLAPDGRSDTYAILDLLDIENPV